MEPPAPGADLTLTKKRLQSSTKMAESCNLQASSFIRRGEKEKGYPKKDELMATLVKTRKSPYRNLLLKKRQELLASAKRAPEALATSLQTPDEVEFAIKTAQQDLTATTAELWSQMLKEVEGALKRVAGGTYGACEGCGEEISPNRLKAIPWARYCLTCQELRSKN
jgi:DnaK suppressor protein